MSQLGQTRKSAVAIVRSGLPPKETQLGHRAKGIFMIGSPAHRRKYPVAATDGRRALVRPRRPFAKLRSGATGDRLSKISRLRFAKLCCNSRGKNHGAMRPGGAGPAQKNR